MKGASSENRTALAKMSEKILHLRPPITHIDFSCLKYTAEEGERLMNALSSLPQPTLLYFDLGRNKDWWKDGSSSFASLLDVLEQQHNLDHLHLALSEFSGE